MADDLAGLLDALHIQRTICWGSNPYPMSPEAYGRQADAYLRHDALDRLSAITAPTLVSWVSKIC